MASISEEYTPPRLFYQASKLNTIPQPQAFSSMRQMQALGDMVGQNTALEKSYVLCGYKAEQGQILKRYQVLQVSQSGMLVSHTGSNYPEPGSKPLTMIDGEKMLVRQGRNLLYISDQQRAVSNRVEIPFQPKFAYEMKDDTFVVFGKQNISQVMAVRYQKGGNGLYQMTAEPEQALLLQNQIKSIMAQSQTGKPKAIRITQVETLEEIDTPEGIKFDKTKFKVSQKCKLVLISVYCEPRDQYSIFCLLQVTKTSLDEPTKQTHAFLKTDIFRLKPGQLLNSFHLSFLTDSQKQNYQNFVKIILCYDCCKMSEVMLTFNLENAKKQDRFVNKLPHRFNFFDVKSCLRIQGGKELIVQDTFRSSEGTKSSWLTVFEPMKYFKKSDPRRAEENPYCSNLLLFEGQEETGQEQCFSLVIAQCQNLMVLNLRRGCLSAFNIERISHEETINHFLSTQNDITTTQKIFNFYDEATDSTFILEHMLKTTGYRDQDLLQELLEKMKGRSGFEVLTNILLYQKLESIMAIRAILDHNQKYLVELLQNGSCTENDKACLRQILIYQKRLELLESLLKIGNSEVFPVLQDLQAFVLEGDFVELTLKIFFENEVEAKIEQTRVSHVYDEVLESLMRQCYHEIALNYENFVSVLPLELLSAVKIADLLPRSPAAIEKADSDSFWGSIQRILSSETNPIISDPKAQDQIHLKIVQELLLDLNMPDKALEVIMQTLEVHAYEPSKDLIELARQCLYSTQEIVPQAGKSILLEMNIPGTQTPLLNFSAGCTDLSEAVELISDFLARGKFLFYRCEGLYKDYLLQLRYYIICLLDSRNRLDFLNLLVSEQAQRNLQVTLSDHDLVQIFLEIMYCPTYKASIEDDAEQATRTIYELKVALLPQVKFMRFTSEVVHFVKKDIIPWIEGFASSSEALSCTSNQKQFIEQNLLRHLAIGNLKIIEEGYMSYMIDKKDNAEDQEKEQTEFEADLQSGNLRFVDLLKLQSDEETQVDGKREVDLMALLSDIIDSQIKKSWSKRQFLKDQLTSLSTTLRKTTELFGLFSGKTEEPDPQEAYSEAKWAVLYEQLILVVEYLGHGSSQVFEKLQKMYLAKMMSNGNFEGLSQLMDQSRLTPEKAIDRSLINQCVLESIMQQYDKFVFERQENQKDDSLDDEENQEEQTTRAFVSFCQQSQTFLGVLVDNSADSSFIEQCQAEIDLLNLTRNLIKEDFLVWQIPTVQIRCDFEHGLICKRILQIHGLDELFCLESQEDEDKDRSLKTLGKFVKDQNFNGQLLFTYEVLMHLSAIKALGSLQPDNPHFELLAYLVDMVVLQYESNLEAISQGRYNGIQAVLFETYDSLQACGHRSLALTLLEYLVKFSSDHNVLEASLLAFGESNQINDEISSQPINPYYNLCLSLHLRSKYQSVRILDNLLNEPSIDFDLRKLVTQMQTLGSDDLSFIDASYVLELIQEHQETMWQKVDTDQLQEMQDDIKKTYEKNQNKKDGYLQVMISGFRQEDEVVKTGKSIIDQSNQIWSRQSDCQEVEEYVQDSLRGQNGQLSIDKLAQQLQGQQNLNQQTLEVVLKQVYLSHFPDQQDIDVEQDLKEVAEVVVEVNEDHPTLPLSLILCHLFNQHPVCPPDEQNPLHHFASTLLPTSILSHILLISEIVEASNFFTLLVLFERIDDLKTKMFSGRSDVDKSDGHELQWLLAFALYIKSQYAQIRYKYDILLGVDEQDLRDIILGFSDLEDENLVTYQAGIQSEAIEHVKGQLSEVFARTETEINLV